MRTLGLILAILGAVVLGSQSFTSVIDNKGGDANRVEPTTLKAARSTRISSLAGGIAIASGLILVVGGCRRD